MAGEYWLSDQAWAAIEPLLPKNQPGARRVVRPRSTTGSTGGAAKGYGRGYSQRFRRDPTGPTISASTVQPFGPTVRPMAEKGGEGSGHRAFARRATTKIHALTDTCGRAVAFILSPGNLADISLAPALLSLLPAPNRLLADKGYDANSLRRSLAETATEAVIPSKRSRKAPLPYDATAYRDRNKIERAFCRLKNWRRIATRYDKLAENFASAVAIAATIIWWT